jgi:hypothetical protein
MAKVAKPSGDELVLLTELLTDFKSRNLPAAALTSRYEDVKLTDLKAIVLRDSNLDEVDFDLALKSLEKKKLIRTGPWEILDPPKIPGVGFGLLARSRYEWVALTQEGYAVARESGRAALNRGSHPPSHVSFHNVSNATIAVGNHISQTVTYPEAAWYVRAKAAIEESLDDASTEAALTAQLDELQHATTSKTGFLEKAQTTFNLVANAFQLAGLTVPALFEQIHHYIR